MLKTKHVYDRKVAAIHRLRVNVKSLAAEARIIRREERRADIMYAMDLHLHRVGRLREESRYALLALGFIRGRSYSQCERIAKSPPIPGKLLQKLTRFTSAPPTIEQLALWFST